MLLAPTWAKKPETKVQPIRTEQEQQFTYYWYAAKQAIVEERYGDAYVLLKFCNAINPNDGATLCFLGIIEQGIGNKMVGLLYLHDAFEADPRDQWYQYANALIELNTPVSIGEWVRVLEKAHEAQSGQPADENLLIELRRAYIATAQWKKALAVQEEIDQVQGIDQESVYYRFQLYSVMGKEKKAIQTVDQYLEQNPENMEYLPAMLLNNYAYYTATHKGDLQKAEKMSAITIRQEPNNPIYLDTYGWIMHLQGQNELAYFYLKKAQWNETDETRKDIQQHLEVVKTKVDIYEK